MRINILICGLVRTPDLLVRSVKTFSDLRQKNKIDKIVFSTWKDQIDKYNKLREFLINSGIILLESDEPKFGGTSIFHQMKALDLALRLLPENSLVLKTRADVFIQPEFVEMLADNEDFIQINTDGQQAIFEKKIWLPWFEITKPFYMADECFFGLYQDIKKIVNYDVSYDVLYDVDCGLGHIRRFIHPFLKNYPILENYLKTGAKTGHNTPQRFDILKNNLCSDTYLQYLATYYLILKKYFRIESCYAPNQICFRKWSEPVYTIDDNLFAENFTPTKSWNPNGGQIYAYNENWLSNLLNQQIHTDQLVTKFYKALQKCRGYQAQTKPEKAVQNLDEKYSNQIDLEDFFRGVDDYVILKLSDDFPNYSDYSDIDILCRNRDQFLTHILKVGQKYEEQGFRIETSSKNGHLHIDFYPPNAEKLNFRFDLMDALAYTKFRIDPAYGEVVLNTTRTITCDETQILVPEREHDLAIRFMEYLQWKDSRPDKVKHVEYIRKIGCFDFIYVVNKYTDLNVTIEQSGGQADISVVRKDTIGPGSTAKSRMDYFLIWGHGLQYTREILNTIRSIKDFEIITIVKKPVDDIAKFIRDIYACDTVSFKHLVAKTKYLLKTPPEILFILVKNNNAQERFVGEGRSRHIQCQLIKDVKENIRNRFNPRFNGKRTEYHVIHTSDYESQVEHVLKTLGLPDLQHYTRQRNSDLHVPLGIEPFDNYTVREVSIDCLYANILGAGVVPITETPHYKYLTGDKAAYEDYHAKHFGKELTDDHFSEAYDRLIANFRYDFIASDGKRSLILTRPINNGKYQILDGVHRAAVLKHRAVDTVTIAQPLLQSTQHQHLHGNNIEFVRHSFGQRLPRDLFALEEECSIGQSTAGYHVEATKNTDAHSINNAVLSGGDMNKKDVSIVKKHAIEIGGKTDSLVDGPHDNGVDRDLWRKKILFLTVGCINYDCNINFYKPLKQIFSSVINYNYIEKIKQIGKESMNAEIIEIIRKERPDYVLFHTYQDQVKLETLDTINALGTKVVAWFSDDHWRFENYSKIIAKHVFCSVTTDKNSAEKYMKSGLNVIRSQWASNQDYYQKIDSEFVYEVSFVGQNYGKRQENLLYLRNSGVPVAVFGKRFGRFLEFNDIIKIFNTSKINLNFSGSSSNDDIKQIKGRVFEVPMCGGFLLTEYVDGIEEYYEIGKEIECFKSIAEAVEKISYYLKHNDKRMEIANSGYRRALREHTWVKRLKGVFDEVNKIQLGQQNKSCIPLSQEKKAIKPVNTSHSVGGEKRILLTTSAAPTQSPFSTGEKRPPIGIGFLISSLRNAGHKVFFIDNYLQPSNFLETDYLRENEIDYIGIYANTICFRDTLRMMHKLEHLRQTNKWNGKIVVGGPHTTVAVNTIPDFVDYVVQGEGEQAILDIVEGKVTQRLVSYPRIENLDELPMPAWDYFVKLPYNWNVRFFEDQPVFTMNTSRGCPFRCQFCSVGSIWGKKYTYFSAERIVSDIEHLVRHYGAKGIYFREDNFTLNKERLRKFCNLLLEKGIKISWACESRVSNLSRDIIELMAGAGAKGFYFGVESGSQKILDFLHKDITVEQVRKVFNWCHEFNVKAAASIIIGVPGETESDRRKTNELLKQIKPDVIWNNVFVGIPDSNLYRIVLNNRLYEYIDDRGLVYLQGHNSRVKYYYRDNRNAYIPDNEKNKDMTIKPKVSVLISVYNCEKFIEQALKSIYNQTYQDFEVVIVDDGSTDKTSDILLNMKDSRTSIYRNSENKGLTISLNIGLKLCRGEYVARLDADDISLPQRFEKQVRFLDENPNCVAVGSWCTRIDSNGKVINNWHHPTGYEDIKKRLLVENSIFHSSAMVQRQSLVEIGGYNEKYKYAQDYDLWLRLSEVAEIQNLGEYLYLSRSSPESVSATRKEQQDKYAELARQEALQRKNIQKLKMTSETSMSASIDEKNSRDSAVDYFLKAGDELNGENFETAIDYIQKYRSMIDYSKFPRILNETSKSGDIDVSVIIVTYNRTEDLKRCLESLSKQDDANFEVIVVDNGGSDFEVFQQYVDQYIKCPINFFLSEGRNIGACCAKSKILAFLDDDALVPSNYISSIKAAFETYDIFGIRGKTYPKSSSSANNHLNIYDLGDRPFPSYCNQEGNSAWLLEVYKSMDGMDPLLFGHEGSDLTFRIIKEYKQPNKVIYWPHTIIYHDYGTADKLRLKKRIHQRSANYLKYKHKTDIFVNRKDIEKYPLPLKQTQVLLDKASSTPEGSIFQPTRCARHPVKPSELPKVKYPNTVSAASTNHLNPRVSIVISCYNCENFLPECLDSIRNQTMNDWELFLLDDASTDGTRSIIEKYAQIDERIKPYYFRDNRGPYVRRNFAIERANSDFIVIQDADDIMYPPKLEILYNEIAKDERLEVVGSFYRMCLEQSKGLEYADKIELPITHDEIMQQYSLERYVCWHGSAIIRKSMFEQIGLYDEHPYGSDKFWLAKAAEYSRCSNEVRFKNVPEYLTLKREHSSSQQGLLPTLDPRSRRARFQTYWEYKLLKIREKLHNNPDVDIKAELKNCKCNDYIKRYGCLFEQWERQPLDNTILCRFISRGIRRFNEGKYVRCIIILDSAEKIINDITKRFKNYDLLRAMAHFKIDRKQQCLRYLNREIQNHNNPAAGKFLSDYFEKNLRLDVQNWCSQNSRHYNLQLVDLENESCQQRQNNNISEAYVSEQQSEQKGIQQSSCCKRSEPLVSVIMPAYNAQKFITEAIQSVLSQTYRNFELVVVDDGSTDGTKDIVFSFKDERIKYFYHENSGLAATHNTGIKNSKGLFLVKLDSDDMMTADFIAAHLAEFEKHPDVDLVYCDDCLIEENSNPIRVIERPEYTDRRLLIRDLFNCGFPVVPFRTCIRRSVFDKIGFFDEELLVGEDYDMMRRFVKAGLKIHHLKGALYLRRMTSDSLSRNFTSQNAKFHFDVVGRFTDTFTCDELFPDVAWDQIAPQMRQLHAKCLTAGTYLAIGQEYVKTNATEYSRTAFDRACSELNDCVKMDPENQALRQLLQKSKLIRARYTEAPQQLVSK